MRDAKESILEMVRIAQNCPADWDLMVGDSKQRYCSQCKLNVFNLSAMTAAEAEAFLCASSGNQTCVRFYQRVDGKIMTADCPLGVKIIDRSIRYGRLVCDAVVAVIVFVVSITFCWTTSGAAGKSFTIALAQEFEKITKNMAYQGNMVAPNYGSSRQ